MTFVISPRYVVEHQWLINKGFKYSLHLFAYLLEKVKLWLLAIGHWLLAVVCWLIIRANS
jgi:hypothetical protein